MLKNKKTQFIIIFFAIILLIIIPNKVKAIDISSIEITTPATKTEYMEGENFDKAGMVVTATYNDGTKATITNYRILRGDNLEVGQRDVLINYTAGDRELEALQPITVKKISSIEITTPATKTEYMEGENFDKAGMVVTATYNDGTKATITNYKILSGDNLEVGQREVLINYTAGGRELEALQPITVKEKNETDSFNWTIIAFIAVIVFVTFIIILAVFTHKKDN